MNNAYVGKGKCISVKLILDSGNSIWNLFHSPKKYWAKWRKSYPALEQYLL